MPRRVRARGNQMPGNRVFRIDTGTASPLPGRDSSGCGLPRRRTMKVVKILLTLVIVVGVLGGAAYGAGRLVDHLHPARVASTSDLPETPAPSSPGTPASSPTASPPSSPTHQATVDTAVLKPGAQ